MKPARAVRRPLEYPQRLRTVTALSPRKAGGRRIQGGVEQSGHDPIFRTTRGPVGPGLVLVTPKRQISGATLKKNTSEDRLTARRRPWTKSPADAG